MRADTARGLVLGLSILCLGLGAAVVYLLRTPPAWDDLETTMADPSVRREVVDELVAQSPGIFDSFHDPDVGRILQPGLTDRATRDASLTTNPLGMREREFARPKPPGTIRVVLLGDSFVFGPRVDAAERLGHHLERTLRERAASAGGIEVLHFAIPSWNLRAECAWLGRQLHGLQPDLVFQVAVNNDLDDVSGVRGFGTQARFSPQRRRRAGGMVNRRHPASVLGFNRPGFVAHAIDDEGRARYREAAQEVGRLADLVTAQGGRYVLVMNWMGVQAAAAPFFASVLEPDQLLWMPFSFFRDDRYRISARDGHWNPAGHARVALALHGAIQARGLLPGLDLAPWDQAVRHLRTWEERAREEILATDDPLLGRRIGPVLDFADLDAPQAAQVHGGVYPGGWVGPYASMVLARSGGDRLVMEGEFPPDAWLAGRVAEVRVEEFAGVDLRIEPGQPFRLEVPLPDAVRSREHLTVRLLADDWVYRGDLLELAVVLRLRRLAVE